MSYSYTQSRTVTFTLTHARELAAKVATDLKRIQRFYGSPTDAWIANFEAELVAYLKAGYLSKVTYGFKRGGQWIEPSLTYTARELGEGATNDDPGRVKPGKDVTDAHFTSFLSQNSVWSALTNDERAAFRKTLPFARVEGSEPSVNGYLEEDRTYSAGGRSLSRSTVRSWT